jgi:hypothetical protein
LALDVRAAAQCRGLNQLIPVVGSSCWRGRGGSGCFASFPEVSEQHSLPQDCEDLTPVPFASIPALRLPPQCRSNRPALRCLIVILGKFRISGIGNKISNGLKLALQRQPRGHRRNAVATLKAAQTNRRQIGRVGDSRPLKQHNGTQPLHRRGIHLHDSHPESMFTA